MAQIKTIDTVAGENQIDFKRRYPFVWLKNLGDADVYISDKAGIVAEADGVVLLGAGQAAMLENYDDCVYVLGATTIEAHGQHSADSPFGDTIVAGGGGGGGGTIESLTVTQNGVYTASGGVDGYSPVTVEVPDPPAPVLIEKTITQNGVYDPEDDNADGYSMIDVEVPNKGQINPFPAGASTITLYNQNGITVTSSSIDNKGTGILNISETSNGYEGMVIELNVIPTHIYAVDFDYQNINAAYWNYPAYRLGWLLENTARTYYESYTDWPENIARDSDIHHHRAIIEATGDKIYMNFNLCGYSDGQTNTAEITNLKVYDYSSGGVTVESFSINQNGTYVAPAGKAYSPVTVAVSPNVSSKSIDANGTYTASSENLDGYSSVTVAVPQTTIESLSVTDNGTYTAISGKAFSPVVVNVPTGPEIITRANWDLMTESQKQAKGLVAIQDSSTGFLRGEFVNGADYIQRNKYIPYSDEYKVLGVAYPDLFDASANSWGYGINPVLYTGTGGKPTLSTQEQAILFPTNTSDVVGYVDLGAINTPFTAYIVMKCISPAGRILCCTEQASMNRLIMLNGDGDNVSVDSWGSGSSLGVSAVSDYFVAAMTSSVTTGYGYAYDAANDTVNSMNKSLTATGRYITIGRTDIDPNVMYPSPTDLYLKYIAVVSEVENGTTIINNIRNLYNQFVASE